MGRPIRVHLLRYHIVLEIEFRAEQRERLFGLEDALWVRQEEVPRVDPEPALFLFLFLSFVASSEVGLRDCESKSLLLMRTITFGISKNIWQ